MENDNLLSSLAEKVSEDEVYMQMARNFFSMQHVYSAAIKQITAKLEILDSEFRIKYDYNPIHHIDSRLKSPQSIYDKMKRKNIPLSMEGVKENVLDVAGVRVTVNYIDDIDRLAALLIKQSDVTLINVKDYVRQPKPNGYRSLHVVVKIPVFLAESVEYVPVEVQIRTIAMDFWASLEHRLRYKSGGTVSPELAVRLKNSAEQIAALDKEMQEIHKEIDGIIEEEDDFNGGIPKYLLK